MRPAYHGFNGALNATGELGQLRRHVGRRSAASAKSGAKRPTSPSASTPRPARRAKRQVSNISRRTPRARWRIGGRSAPRRRTRRSRAKVPISEHDEAGLVLKLAGNPKRIGFSSGSEWRDNDGLNVGVQSSGETTGQGTEYCIQRAPAPVWLTYRWLAAAHSENYATFGWLIAPVGLHQSDRKDLTVAAACGCVPRLVGELVQHRGGRVGRLCSSCQELAVHSNVSSRW